MNTNKAIKYITCALLLTTILFSLVSANSNGLNLKLTHNNIEDIIGNPAYDDMQIDLEAIEEMFNYDREYITESDILNPFAQPNENLANSYGSGDANEDGFVDWTDHDEMINSAPQNDYADINGDGNSSLSVDIILLWRFLNPDLTMSIKLPINHNLQNLRNIQKFSKNKIVIINQIRALGPPDQTHSMPFQEQTHLPYLPGHFNSLTTAEERMDWVENMMAIDLTDEIPYHGGNVEERWISGNYATQTHLNFWGYDGDDIHPKYNQDYLGRFNLPVYQFSYYNPNNGLGHGMNAVLVGDDPLNIYDWALIEPQNDGFDRVDQYILNFLAGKDFFIAGIEAFDSQSSPDMPNVIAILGGSVDENGNFTWVGQNPDLILTRPGNMPVLS